MRLQKFLADAGLASRRAAEGMITAGRVAVNGETVARLGTRVDPASDRVTVDGKVIRALRRLYVALNKPRGYLCTKADPQGRRTVGQLLPKEWSNLYPVGRLDRDTEGLLFLTNDGDFCLRLTHPRYGVRKTYLVEVEGRIPSESVIRLTRGVEEGGEQLKAETAQVLGLNKTRSLLRLTLCEGKNREVRRLLAALGLGVLALRRIEIGPIKLGELPEGRWRVLTADEVKRLLRVGATAATQGESVRGGGRSHSSDDKMRIAGPRRPRRRNIDIAGP
jgi:23S rRNA pseudouridine2605 synthase